MLMLPASGKFMILAAIAVAIGRLPHGVQAQAVSGSVRVVHMAPATSGVDVLIDGQRQVPDLSFRSASAYTALSAGPHTLQLIAPGTPQTVLLSTSLPMNAGQDQTVVALGAGPQLNALVLADDNSAPAAGKAKVRFVHAGADVPAVDIAVRDGPILFHDVAFRGVAGPVEVAAGSYSLEVRAAGMSTVLLSLPNVTLQEGQIVSVFGAGLRSDNSFTVVQVPYPVSGQQTFTLGVAAPVTPATPIVSVASMPATGSGGFMGRRLPLAGRLLTMLGSVAVALGVAAFGASAYSARRSGCG